MARVWKETLCVGRQQDRDGKWFEITPREIQEASRNAEKLLARGFPVPAVWEHQNVEAGDSEEWKARYAKNVFGFVGDQRINDRGNLDLALDIADEKDAEQAKKTRFVSPKLYRGYWDPQGGVYRGTTIAHVAATPTPVQFWQRPLEFSQDEPLYLSFARDDDMADDKESGDKGGKSADTGNLSKLIEALKGVGHNIPDEAKSIDDLIIAVKAGGPVGGADSDLDDLSQAGDATAPAGGAPMLMSTTDRHRQQAWARDERKELWARTKDAFHSGRMTRTEASQFKRRIEACEMSFSPEGEAKHPLNAKLTEIEARPEWSKWSKDGKRPVEGTELSTTKVDPPPELTADQQRDKAREEAASDQVERVKKYLPAAAK